MFNARTYLNFVSTSCQPKRKSAKPENLLKTKGREGRFSSNKAENMLKTRQLRKSAGTRNCEDNVSGRKGAGTYPPPPFPPKSYLT